MDLPAVADTGFQCNAVHNPELCNALSLRAPDVKKLGGSQTCLCCARKAHEYKPAPTLRRNEI